MSWVMSHLSLKSSMHDTRLINILTMMKKQPEVVVGNFQCGTVPLDSRRFFRSYILILALLP